MFLAHRQLDKIKSLNLPEIVSSYGISVKHSGNSSYQALCPFHADKNPSLSISFKGDKWLWHCFGCSAKGTVVDFVMKKEGLSFKEAYKKLSEATGINIQQPASSRKEIAPGKPKAKSQESKTESNPQELLNKIADFYHSTFKEDRRGLEYLTKRGISAKEIYLDFKIGFVNGSLKKTLPEAGPMFEQLKELGLLNEKGNECFYNCVVFPIFDENNQVVSLYGRNIEGKQHPALARKGGAHLYLAGPHRGVFNAKVLRTTKSIFLTESIIDALSLYQLGFKETIPLYGTNGLTSDHLELFKKYEIAQAYLCLDNDAAGKEASLKVAQELSSLGIKSLCISLPEGIKDGNDYLLSGKTKDDFTQLIAEARPLEFRQEDLFSHRLICPSGPLGKPKISQEEDQIIFDFSGRSYRIRGLTIARLDQLKVNIKLCSQGFSCWDSLDLYSAKARAAFILEAKKALSLEPGTLNAELAIIIEHLENEQARLLEENRSKKPQERPQLTEEEKAQALEFLKSPDLFERIIADFKACGYVGEETNLLLGYITSISRKLQEPLAVLIVSRSASGKSTLQDAVLSFTPPEDYEKYTRLTDQALFYKDENALRHKLLAIEEEKGASGAGYSLRNLQSAHGLRSAATIKDPNTGKLNTAVYQVSGPTSMMLTTTYYQDFDFETYNRFIILTVDESWQQTKAILTRQRLNETLEGTIFKRQRERIRKLHHNVQRLLKPLEVVNPYSQALTFIDSMLRARREQPKYLSIIKAIALLRQYQKELKSYSEGNETFGYIEVDLKDIEIANSIANQILGRSLDEMSPPARRLLLEIKKLVDKLCLEQNILQDRCIISRRDIREFTGWSDYQVRTHIRELEELEYLIPASGSKGKRFTYQLVWDGQGTDGSKFMLSLIAVHKLQNYEGKFSYYEGTSRPLSGASSGNLAPQLT
ncbi:MAG: CHC2 zinc finger domain-containing protein [Candidatus Omnitrophota bacterium]|nr:CHC2 zinc finger domain-containing protein [Candidatus Omnitrophota bacterium]